MAKREDRLLSPSSRTGDRASFESSLQAIDPNDVAEGEQPPAQLLTPRTAASTSSAPNQGSPIRDDKGKQPLVEKLAPTPASPRGETSRSRNAPQCVKDLKRLLRRPDPEAMAPLHARALCAALQELGIPPDVDGDELCNLLVKSKYADENGFLYFEVLMEFAEDLKLLEVIGAYKMYRKKGLPYFPPRPLRNFFESLDKFSGRRLWYNTEAAPPANENVEITTSTCAATNEEFREEYTGSRSIIPHNDDKRYTKAILRAMFPKDDDKGKQTLLLEPLVRPASTPTTMSREVMSGTRDIGEETGHPIDDFTENITEETADNLQRHASDLDPTFENFLRIMSEDAP